MKTTNVALVALGDPTRQQIVRLLAREPLAVGEIAARLPVTRPAVSKHLRVLAAADLVTSRSEGTRNIYALKEAGLQHVHDYLDDLWNHALRRYRLLAENTGEARR